VVSGLNLRSPFTGMTARVLEGGVIAVGDVVRATG
jgi:MOSC domain-containing protein YiiM